MEQIWQITVLVGSICGILSFVMLLVIGVYLVKFKDTIQDFFRDLLGVIAAVSEEGGEVVQPTKKTWDEKYEEALNEFEEFRRQQAGGLVDIDEQSNNYGKPPKPNAGNGLTVNE
jgi:hypothetical protein